MAEESNELARRLRSIALSFATGHYQSDVEAITEAAAELDRLRTREAELLAQIESMRTGLDDALDKVRRRLSGKPSS